MTKVKLIMLLALVFALGAGAVAGYVGATRLPPHAGDHGAGGPGGNRDRETDLARELNLTDAQREQMRKIWSDAMQGAGREHMDKLRSLQRERDDAFLALLTPEQKQSYEKIQADYRDKTDAMGREREKAFTKAIEQTNQILDPQQQQKYAEIRKRRSQERSERGDWRGGRRGASTTQAATHPVAP
jgi:Spy/CpxP family protein refolding chaperone